ncbi:ATP-dependent nuclease [Microbispora rosea]|uniref:ATP-dependent nuclease n=1 Tax=Microbispora rosea TaxID=58117 RepID=UPI0037A93F0C
MRLRNFKAFEKFAINFQDTSFLVGPNSAGKSTILTALRLAEACLRLARRNRPSLACQHRDGWVQAHPTPIREFEALNESIRHDFRNEETSLELTWRSGYKLRAVWLPVDDDDEIPAPFFYLLDKDGRVVRTPKEAREGYPTVGIIPTLSPLEHEEQILNYDYVRKNFATRLSSRHFRNNLRMLVDDGDWESFIDFADPWLGGIRLSQPVSRYRAEGESSIDVFYTEPGSRAEKELVWAGDGVQIWLQLLLHLYRAQDLPTLVLDEPEVFLHADLQRRLVRLLDSLPAQVVLATHSSEVLAEAPRDAIVWVDKTRARAIRSPKDESMAGLDAALGSAFNLGLARALRARGVLFVEGKDLKILKLLGKRLGLERIVQETVLAAVPINGYSNWNHVEPFKWFADQFLQNAVRSMILLDRDYRSDQQVAAVEEKLKGAGFRAHVWKRKELESYLLLPAVISRLSRCPLETVTAELDRIVASKEDSIFARFLAEVQGMDKYSPDKAVAVTRAVLRDFRDNWESVEFRYSSCPPKDVLSAMNRFLQGAGFKAVSFEAIAKNVKSEEMFEEMVQVLMEINALPE